MAATAACQLEPIISSHGEDAALIGVLTINVAPTGIHTPGHDISSVFRNIQNAEGQSTTALQQVLL